MYYQYQSSSLSLNITIQAHLSTTLYILYSIFFRHGGGDNLRKSEINWKRKYYYFFNIVINFSSPYFKFGKQKSQATKFYYGTYQKWRSMQIRSKNIGRGH